MRTGIALIICILSLTSCAGPDFQAPRAPDVASYTADRRPQADTAGHKTQHLDVSNDLPADWWTLFHSAPLKSLIERALHDNPNMEQAQAALRVAQANVYAQVGILFPQVGLNYQAEGGKVATGVSAPTVDANGGNPSYYTLHTGSLNLSFVPDVWGGNRRQIENLEALKETQRFQNEATFVTLTSTIASGAIQEASLRAQIRVTKKLVALSKDILGKMRLQRDAGQISDLDLASQEALVAQTEATLPPLEKQLAITRDQLIVLSGHLPGEGLAERFEFSNLSLPRQLPVSVPVSLVSQRPDVRAAEASVHAACAQIGVTVANRLPQFTITGQMGRSDSLFKNLFSSNPAFYFYTGVANASQVLFDGFTLQQKQRAAEAGLDQAMATYKLSVLTAYQNVADVLYSLHHDTVALQKALLAEQATAKTLRLTRLQMDQGQVAIQQVLNAQTASLQASLTVIQAQANRYTDTVGLFQALGGGWWNRAAPPQPGEPEAWLTSVAGLEPDPLKTAYPGASHHDAR